MSDPKSDPKENSPLSFSQVRLVVSGSVQGVFFRVWVREIAEKLNLNGFVRNTEDGKVEIVAEGKKEDLEKLIDLSYQGPPSAKVTKIDLQWLEDEPTFNHFEIR
jgi:acylphosphatase